MICVYSETSMWGIGNLVILGPQRTLFIAREVETCPLFKCPYRRFHCIV